VYCPIWRRWYSELSNAAVPNPSTTLRVAPLPFREDLGEGLRTPHHRHRSRRGRARPCQQCGVGTLDPGSGGGALEAVAPAEHRDAYVWVVTRHEMKRPPYPPDTAEQCGALFTSSYYLRAVLPGEAVAGAPGSARRPRGARFDRHVEFIGADGKPRVRRRFGRSSTARPAARSACRRRWRRPFPAPLRNPSSRSPCR
jgi:hypothetical protein